MQTEQKKEKEQRVEEKEVFTFTQEERRWYIYLDAYLSLGWSKQDLEVTEGAHQILNILSWDAKKLRLRLSVKPFEGANELKLVEHCATPKGGGIYLLNPKKKYNGSLYWICELALLVFGDIPERIYLIRLPLSDEEILNGEAKNSYPLQLSHNPPWFKKVG